MAAEVFGVKDLLTLRDFFPLKDVRSVVKLFKDQIESCEPNLAVLSLVCGFIEYRLTDKAALQNTDLVAAETVFPVLDFDEFSRMYGNYLDLIKTKLSNKSNEDFLGNDLKESFSSREQVKNIADFVWGQLSTSYFKDRPHIQNVYSFLNGKRLDCFGVALLVVATAQCIGHKDIHLVLSEDHAWLSFGEDSKETAEVTWHGKRDGIKRGNPICQDSLVEFDKDWLYLGGKGMHCNRFLEVAAIVSAMNPGINVKTDSETLGRLQQDLLWLLFDYGHLDKYPMAICNLADLEEIEETRRAPSIEDLYLKAISAAEIEYSGYHVYPYTYYGGYLHRKGNFCRATKAWKDAAIAASRYTHSREDEELYKDLNEIANTFFPEIIKHYRNASSKSNQDCNEENYFSSCDNLTNILKFYDGVFCWEEGGSTTAVHSEWAKNFVKLLNCFTYETRVGFVDNLSFAEPTKDLMDKNDVDFPRSSKMKLIIKSVRQEKINSQVINLHLTSQVGLIAEKKTSAKRANDLMGSSTGLSGQNKRMKR